MKEKAIIKKHCEMCSSEFEVIDDKRISKKRFCSTACSSKFYRNRKRKIDPKYEKRAKSISEAIKKRGGAWNKGLNKNDHDSLKKVGNATKKRDPWNKAENYTEFVVKTCENCGKDFSIDWAHRKNRFCSVECSRITITEENNPNWVENREEVSMDYTRKFFSREYRKLILIDQFFRCPVCHCHYNKMRFDLHHIDHNKKNDNRENLIFLCSSCHNYERHHREIYENKLSEINEVLINNEFKERKLLITSISSLSEDLMSLR